MHIPPPYIEKSFFEDYQFFEALQEFLLDDFVLFSRSCPLSPRKNAFPPQIAANQPSRVRKFTNLAPNRSFLDLEVAVCNIVFFREELPEKIVFFR